MKLNYLLLCLALLIGLSACNKDTDTETDYETVENFYRSVSAIEVEVAYEPGAEPYTQLPNGDNIWLFTKTNIEALFSGRDLNVEVTVPPNLAAMNPIPDQGRDNYTAQNIVNIANQHRKGQNSANLGNLWVVFLISGLWHGAAWNFVVWGAFHGLFLILDRMFFIRFTQAIGKYPSIIITYFITLIGWVLFRAESLDFAFGYIGRMFAFDSIPTEIWFDAEFNTMILAGALFGFIAAFGRIEQQWMNLLEKPKNNVKTLLMILIAVFFTAICIGAITSSSFNPFIYFRF